MVDLLRSYFRNYVAKLPHPFLREFLLFGLKQAWACVFGGAFLVAIIGTKFWYPDIPLHRYDFLFCYAVAIQVLLISFKLESWRELGVIMLFHALATLMELFKTHDSIGSWRYPEESVLRIGNVPLFTGFMYSAVGSYLARIWRGFEMKFDHFPPLGIALALALLSYANFFTHHFVFDIRWILIACIVLCYARTKVYFRPDRQHRSMPLLLGFILVAFFIWLAENIGTFARAWIYPNQENGWELISLNKWTAWFLLIQLSFVFIYALRQFESKLQISQNT